MKKTISAFILFLIIFISLSLNPSQVCAAINCYTPHNAADDCKIVGGYIVCELPGGTHQCCDTQADCDALQTVPPTCASQNPAASCYPNTYVCAPQNPPINPNIGCAAGEQCGVNCVPPTTLPPPPNCVANNVCKTASQTCCSGVSRATSGALCSSGQQCVSSTSPYATSAKICDFAGTNKADCDACADGTEKYSGQGPGVWTALGCIPTNSSLFIGKILGIGIGIGGGIAFLLILFGGFQMLTSAGNPEKLNAGKELVTSAIAGLLIIIFSIFILRLIGVTILHIPGFE
jgi:hypothetical protein